MPPIEVGQVSAIQALSARIARPAGDDAQAAQHSTDTRRSTGAGPAIEVSASLDPSQPPVDSERVSMIRKAVEEGHYPVIPTQIADAMIAAQVMLRSPAK